jgi:5-methylcytosine-specific restriction enzyme A
LNGSWRTEPLPPDWATYWRPRILRRDPFCMFAGGCGLPSTEVDHVIRGAGTNDANLQGLCSGHHKAKSSSEGGQASGMLRSQIARRKFREPERHPGLK